MNDDFYLFPERDGILIRNTGEDVSKKVKLTPLRGNSRKGASNSIYHKLREKLS